MSTPACPACGAQRLMRISATELRCPYCASTFHGKPYLCPTCGWVNTSEADTCPNCGEPLSIVSQVIDRRKGSANAPWIERVRSQAQAIQTSEELSSQQRMQQLLEIDRIREEQELRDRQLQMQRDKQLFVFIFIFALVVIAFIILAMILMG